MMITAAQYLQHNDPFLAPIITQAGACTISPHTDYYEELVRSIIGQQLSLKAAAAINGRFQKLYGSHFPTPEEIVTTPHETLRAVGLSNAKARYIQSLAAHVLDGSVRFDHFEAASDDTIITELTQVKGIGVWTVHMFLMFCMGRTDVLPYSDLGIRVGIRQLYGLTELPTQPQVEAIAEKYSWAPYRSIASWYVWKSVDQDWDTVKKTGPAAA